MALTTLTSLIVLTTLYAFYHIITEPLKAFPGPFFAKFTDLWRAYTSSLGHAHLVNRKMHNQLGPAVRMGPNMVSLSDVELIKTLYSNDEQYLKVSPRVCTGAEDEDLCKEQMILKICPADDDKLFRVTSTR